MNQALLHGILAAFLHRIISNSKHSTVHSSVIRNFATDPKSFTGKMFDYKEAVKCWQDCITAQDEAAMQCNSP